MHLSTNHYVFMIVAHWNRRAEEKAAQLTSYHNPVVPCFSYHVNKLSFDIINLMKVKYVRTDACCTIAIQILVMALSSPGGAWG